MRMLTGVLSDMVAVCDRVARAMRPKASQAALLAQILGLGVMLARGKDTLCHMLRPLSILRVRHCRHFLNYARAMVKPLNYHDGPLVWVDCEMTGLDPRTDKILEIAVG